MLRYPTLVVVLMVLTGCANLNVMRHVPLATMARLSSMRVTDIVPAELRVAARLPANLEPLPRGVKIQVELPSAGTSSGKREFVLEPALDGSELQPLAAYARPGSRLWVYKLSAVDVARLASLRDQVSADKRNGSLSIAAGVDACHRSDLGSAPLPTTTYVRTNSTGYFPLAEDLDIRSIVTDAELAAKVPSCAQ